MGNEDVRDLPRWRDTNKRELAKIRHRVRIAMDSILEVRSMDSDRFDRVLLGKDGSSSFFNEDGIEQKYLLFAQYAVGLLRYVETGETEEIKEERLRMEVEKRENKNGAGIRK